MSNYILTDAWKTACKPTEKLVLISLADQANDAGICWPSNLSIQKRTNLSDRAIQKAIATLVESGHVTVNSRVGRSNYYTVHPRTTFTPEQYSPPNSIHPTPEPRSEDPRTTFTHNHKEPSLNPKESATGKKSPQITFATFLKNCAAKDELPIPEDDKVFEYAAKAGIPQDFLKAHWLRFRENYEGVDKKYSDWRATFRNSVKGNWYKFWYVAPDGTVEGTTHLRQFIAASGVTA